MGRLSKWLKSGWYIAICSVCHLTQPFQDRILRDDWAGEHEAQTGHYIDCIDGE